MGVIINPPKPEDGGEVSGLVGSSMFGKLAHKLLGGEGSVSKRSSHMRCELSGLSEKKGLP